MSERKQRGLGLARIGMFLAFTAPWVLVIGTFFLPPWRHVIRPDMRTPFAVLMLAWVAAGFILPCVTLWLATRSRKSALGVEPPPGEPAEWGGTGHAKSGLAGCFIGFVILAIAIPSNVHPRRSEALASAIGDIRTVITAEVGYQSTNPAGGYGTLECLAHPARCIPGYEGPTFLDPRMLNAQRGPYTFTFHAGAPATAPNVAHGLVRDFAYSAVAPDDPERHPFLCGDASGRVCRIDGAADVPVTGARCPDACAPIL
jgi:hypothetical protein